MIVDDAGRAALQQLVKRVDHALLDLYAVPLADQRIDRAIEAMRRASDELAAVVPRPLTEWRCFQCDEVFTDKAEALEHFGDYPDDSPLCLIKGEDGGLAARIRALEAELSEAYNQRNEYENDARLWHESEADRVRRIGHVQWWQELDSKEGERLALIERVHELEVLAAVPRAKNQEAEKHDDDKTLARVDHHGHVPKPGTTA